MATIIRTATITVNAADTVAIFPTPEDAHEWCTSGAQYGDVGIYNGVAVPAIPGTYNAALRYRIGINTEVYGTDYDVPQYHPRVRFPFRVWAIVV